MLLQLLFQNSSIVIDEFKCHWCRLLDKPIVTSTVKLTLISSKGLTGLIVIRQFTCVSYFIPTRTLVNLYLLRIIFNSWVDSLPFLGRLDNFRLVIVGHGSILTFRVFLDWLRIIVEQSILPVKCRWAVLGLLDNRSYWNLFAFFFFRFRHLKQLFVAKRLILLSSWINHSLCLTFIQIVVIVSHSWWICVSGFAWHLDKISFAWHELAPFDLGLLPLFMRKVLRNASDLLDMCFK